MTRETYTAEYLEESSAPDVRIRIDSKTWHMWGRKSLERESSLVKSIHDDSLPVLIGSGIGEALSILVDQGRPVAVVDQETAIHTATGLHKKYSANPYVFWVKEESAENAIHALRQWQKDHGSAPLQPIAIPLYLRLNREYYGALVNTIESSSTNNFWEAARYPKFQEAKPRVLFIDSDYFLCDEITAAFKRLEVPFQLLTLGNTDVGTQSFIESLLRAVVDFKPDYVFTVNHFGLDREGKLAQLLQELQLPLASWFVDNPHLILHEYAHPATQNTVIFTYDAGNEEMLRRKGFDNVHYMPLATDPHRFAPQQSKTTPADWVCDVSFVGNSMLSAVSNSLKDAVLPPQLQMQYEKVAADFGKSGELNVASFLASGYPEWDKAFKEMETTGKRLALESLLTWEATRQYRLNCVSQLLEFCPLIVGDNGWKSQLPQTPRWRHLSAIDYYEELPAFYQQSSINFNCTSQQMKGAVNQRVFDVPATGSFLITDHREQIENLFDIGTEVVVYRNPEEIPGLIKKYLSNPTARAVITSAARRRILAKHTYEVRLSSIIDIMRKTFA